MLNNVRVWPANVLKPAVHATAVRSESMVMLSCISYLACLLLLKHLLKKSFHFNCTGYHYKSQRLIKQCIIVCYYKLRMGTL